MPLTFCHSHPFLTSNNTQGCIGVAVCREHDLLLDKCEIAMKTHSQNVQRVCDVIGSIPHTDFMDLWRTLAQTRGRLEEAQRLLEKHIAEHDCY
jgi:hypothetical protein